MPVRRLSNASNDASASTRNNVTTSAVRLVVTAGESSAGAVGSSTTISASGFGMDISWKGRRCSLPSIGLGEGRKPAAMLVRDETRFGHQALVERVIFFQELQHVLAGEEDRLESLLFHVVLVFRGLCQLSEQVDIERGLLSGYLAGKEHGPQHQV